MTNVNTKQAKAKLSKLLVAVENGDEVIISRGNKPVAKLVPILKKQDWGRRPRPKVGEMIGEPFDIPEDAFAPMTPEELKEWGL